MSYFQNVAAWCGFLPQIPELVGMEPQLDGPAPSRAPPPPLGLSAPRLAHPAVQEDLAAMRPSRLPQARGYENLLLQGVPITTPPHRDAPTPVLLGQQTAACLAMGLEALLVLRVSLRVLPLQTPSASAECLLFYMFSIWLTRYLSQPAYWLCFVFDVKPIFCAHDFKNTCDMRVLCI